MLEFEQRKIKIEHAEFMIWNATCYQVLRREMIVFQRQISNPFRRLILRTEWHMERGDKTDRQ